MIGTGFISDREYALLRKNVFSYGNIKNTTYGKIQIPYPAPPNNELLEPRASQNYVINESLIRQAPSLDQIRSEEIRKLGIKVNLSPESLANSIQNKFIKVNKKDAMGNIINDPITNKPIVEIKSLAELLKDSQGINDAIRILIGDVVREINTKGIANTNSLLQLETSLMAGLNMISTILSRPTKFIQNKVAITNVLTNIKIIKDKGLDSVVSKDIAPTPIPLEISIENLFKNPTQIYYIYSGISNFVSPEIFSDLIWQLAGANDKKMIISIKDLNDPDFWKEFEEGLIPIPQAINETKIGSTPIGSTPIAPTTTSSKPNNLGDIIDGLDVKEAEFHRIDDDSMRLIIKPGELTETFKPFDLIKLIQDFAINNKINGFKTFLRTKGGRGPLLTSSIVNYLTLKQKMIIIKNGSIELVNYAKR